MLISAAELADIRATIELWIASPLSVDDLREFFPCPRSPVTWWTIEAAMIQHLLDHWRQGDLIFNLSNGGEDAADGIATNIGNRVDESLAPEIDERLAQIHEPQNWSVLAVDPHDRATRMRNCWMGAEEPARNVVAAGC
jgi:hypothetical protein